MRTPTSDRGRQRLRTIITIVVTALVIAPAAALAGHQFNDVPNGNVFHGDIQWMKDNGVTAGCNPPANDEYCPDQNVTREQMAAFIHRLETENVFVRPGQDAVDGGNADTVDGKHASAFLPVDGKAANSDKLDGNDSSAFAASGHEHLGQTWTGSGSGLRVRTDALGAQSSPIAGMNTGTATTSELPFGVYGQVDSSVICSSCTPASSAGVFGRNIGGGHGVFGRAGTDPDLWHPVGEVGVAGIGDSRGLYGSGGSSYGVYATSLNWYGLYGRTSRSDHNYGLYTPDNLYARSATTSSTTTVMQNGGTETLESGDVVVFSGMGTTHDGSPVPAVSQSSTQGDPAVAGVVLSAFDPRAAALDADDPDSAAAGFDPTPDGAIAPGAYLLVTVSGPAQVNVAPAEVSGLKPGVMVSTAAAAGSATDLAGTSDGGTTTEVAGSVLGKVLGPSTEASDKVWVFVNVH